MVVEICPRCQQRYSRNEYEKDYIHKCNSTTTAMDQETVKRVGDYEDEVTKETVKVPNALWQGSPNRLKNKRAGIEGGKYSSLHNTVDGSEKKSTHRVRQHYEYIDKG